jgi:ABC-type lipoprotein export system ATPase subunit
LEKGESIGPWALEVVDVKKSYGDRPVVRGVGFRLARGERLALVGPSGSGKTTLLNCIGGVDRPDSGHVRVQGEDITAMDADALAAVRRTRVGTVFQFFHLLPTLTARENVEFPLRLLGMPEARRRERVDLLLGRVGVAHRAGALPSELSGGEMQRVAIARSLAHGPSLLLADEPTGNLDSANGENVLNLLEELGNETGTALVLVTHSLAATRICHRVIHLRDGVVEREESRPGAGARAAAGSA